MTHGAGGKYTISSPALAERQRALDLLFQTLPSAARAAHVASLLAAADNGRLDLGGLLLAHHGSEMASAVWLQPQPGRVAILWPPTASRPEWLDSGDDLLRASLARLAQLDVTLVQSLLPIDADLQAAQLTRCGFAHLADLMYMVSLPSVFPSAAPRIGLSLDVVTTKDERRLSQVLQLTYEGTLDCPRLNGVRKIADVLASYRACGTIGPDAWLIARDKEQDVGCLLLTTHPESNQWEIVYLGLVPAARGHGYGVELSRCAQWRASQAGARRLVVAVDAANQPAVDAYSRAGFVEWDRRRVLLRTLPDGGAEC